MSAPRVVIVGRPNVGKSTLFNALAGRRLSIEDPMAGVTRDRLSFVLGVGDRAIELMDTGGIGAVDEQSLGAEIDRQIELALHLADRIVFVIDAKAGVQPADRAVAERLRRLGVPVLVVANKVEGPRDQAGVGEAHAFGFGEPVAVSAREKLGVSALRERLAAEFGEEAMESQVPGDTVRLAIVGRVNVGKSTLVNALVGEQRVIVSELPGTTRDAVDVPFRLGARQFVAIDTAGIRKDKTVSDSVEFYAQARSLRSIRRADVVLLLIDATADVGRIDREIAGEILQRSVPAIVVITKWDLARERADTETYSRYLQETLPGMDRYPLAFISAIEGLNLRPTLELAASLHDQAGMRVTTGELNRVLAAAWERRRPRPRGGRIGKIFYGSQVGTHPPTIVLFVNEPGLFDDNWRRYLSHELQDRLPFGEVPVAIRYQGRPPDGDPGRADR